MDHKEIFDTLIPGFFDRKYSTIRPGIYMKRMDLFFGGKSTGTLKTPAGQISFCMKNHCETMIY